MSTKSIYFPHFSNALQDEKILKLRQKLGLTGYAIYFALLEKLSATNDYQLTLDSVDSIAFDLRCESNVVLDVINNYKLFTVDNQNFYSTAHRLNMCYKDERKEKMRKVAQARLEKLTPEQLSEQNKKAIAARWDKTKNTSIQSEIQRRNVSDTKEIQRHNVSDTINKDKDIDVYKDKNKEKDIEENKTTSIEVKTSLPVSNSLLDSEIKIEGTNQEAKATNLINYNSKYNLSSYAYRLINENYSKYVKSITNPIGIDLYTDYVVSIYANDLDISINQITSTMLNKAIVKNDININDAVQTIRKDVQEIQYINKLISQLPNIIELVNEQPTHV